jgi:hypothetical protein
MTLSHFDQDLYPFTCHDPKCGKTFQKVLRSLLYAKMVVCPHCGDSEDITESKRTGAIGKALDTASALDKREAEEK